MNFTRWETLRTRGSIHGNREKPAKEENNQFHPPPHSRLSPLFMLKLSPFQMNQPASPSFLFTHYQERKKETNPSLFCSLLSPLSPLSPTKKTTSFPCSLSTPANAEPKRKQSLFFSFYSWLLPLFLKPTFFFWSRPFYKAKWRAISQLLVKSRQRA